MIKKKKLALRTDTIRTMSGEELLQIKGGAQALLDGTICNSHINGCNDPG